MSARFAILAFVSLCVLGCRGWNTDKTPVVPIRNMYNQPRYNMQAESGYFNDHRSMRPEVVGTISQEREVDPQIATGLLEDGQTWIDHVPDAVVSRNGGMEEFLQRGQDRYGIYCVPCHSVAGDGAGMVARRAEETGALGLKPPSFHQNRLRHIPDGQLYSTITNGVRNMPPYRHNIPVDDRWAIVMYVRALQLTQVAPPAPAAAVNVAPAMRTTP